MSGAGAAGAAAPSAAPAPAPAPAPPPQQQQRQPRQQQPPAFAAFECDVVAEDFGKRIGALAVWRGALLAGLADGSLLFFEEPPEGAAGPAPDAQAGGGGGGGEQRRRPPWQVTRAEKGFCKKAILQLEVVAAAAGAEGGGGGGAALLCLTDDGLSLHSLPELRPLAAAPRSARATAFAWNPGRREAAVAARKKVVTYRLAGGGGGGGGGEGEGEGGATSGPAGAAAADAAAVGAGGGRVAGEGGEAQAGQPPTAKPAPGKPAPSQPSSGQPAPGQPPSGQRPPVPFEPYYFQELTEYTTPEAAEAVAWAGDSVIAGTRRSYYLIAPAPPQMVEVLPGVVVQMYPAVAPAPLLPLGAAPAPALAALPPEAAAGGGGGGGGGGGAGEVMVCRDSGSVFVGPDGKASRKGQLQWTEPPTAVIAAGGYAVALLASRVEIRSLSRVAAPAAAQQMPLPGMGVAAAAPPPPAGDGAAGAASAGAGAVFVASAAPGGGVRRLLPVPPERQARALAAAGEFSGALELAARLPDGPRRRALEGSLRLRFCDALFAAGEVDDALTQLSMCADSAAESALAGAGPLLLLRLFPDLVPEKFRPLLPKRAFGEPLPPPPAAPGARAGGGGAAGGGGGAPLALARQGSSGVAGPAGRAAAALGVVVPYLLSYRTRLTAAMAEAAEAGGDAPGAAGAEQAAAAGGQEGGEAEGAPRPEAVACVLDTALLLAMLTQPDSGAALRLLQQANSADLEVGGAALAAAGRYAELAALLQYNGKHEEGLELLRKLSQDPASLPVPPAGAAADLAGLPGVWAAVRYLTTMSPAPTPALAEAHAGWLLGADPEAGLEAFLSTKPPMAPAAVLPILQRHAPDHAVVYLEAALRMGVASPGDYHGLLLSQYLALALEEEAGGGESVAKHARKLSLSDSLTSRPRRDGRLFPNGAAPAAAAAAAAAAGGAAAAADGGRDEGGGGRGDAYGRLRALVYSSTHVDPDAVLAQLPPGALPEIRALMLERLGRHRKDTGQVVDALTTLGVIRATGDRLSVRRAISFFLENLQRQLEREETVGAIGEDLFAIALDSPFRFPATFTFVLRAFSTLEGIGKTLVPTYRFSEVAQPYATELLQLQDAASRQDFLLTQLQQQATELGQAAAAMPTRVAAISETMDQITAGDLKLRVRDLEGERAARRAGIMQAVTLNTVAGMGLLNVGTQLALSGRGGAAGAVMAVAGALGVLVLLGLKRVQRLDKFEKDLRR
ncbi:hypothetical protein Rsub_07874 [Raphidocelis subcapitata]|uniref:CNH domain-containing protein n=1 Tax=Raphidocelis subcapitata TaxID=307507 RepID=A0A2V0P6N1_9CHLO|nr:hypothetical protein Rsub_07874 [Raphidocelis subcapitata]|eukprot:GBF95524.1 hypothetical protein Rsub_07874 [Raphidocelis subcapitata]